MKSQKKFYKDGQHLINDKARCNISFELRMDDRKKIANWTDNNKADALQFLRECMEKVENELYNSPI